MAKKYFTLAVRDEVNNWSPEFGDYDRETVDEERNDYADRGTYRVRDMRIVVSGDNQADIDAAIAKLNADWRQG